MKYKLMFQNSYGQEREIAEVENMAEMHAAVKKFLDEHNYKSYYSRYWLDCYTDEINPEIQEWKLIVDVGSWSEFFIIHFTNEWEANRFRDTDDSMKPF